MELTLAPHLLTSSTDRDVGSVVHFSCDEGWHVVGVTIATCNSSGAWSQAIPACEAGGQKKKHI